LAFSLSGLACNTQSVSMKKILHFFVLLAILPFFSQAQIISEFTWDNNPVTQAAVGPNATSVSTFATSSSGGSGGTNGLSAGTGRHDIDLVVPGAVFVSQPGIDISVDFLKEENGASFFTIGGLDFGITGGSIYVKFLLNVGGSDVAVSGNNIATVPDALFHTYRFIYNNTTGKAVVYIDGVSKYTYQAAAGTALSWTGATTATIASGMDGGNSNIPVLDNLIIQKPPVTLPLDLLSFDAYTGKTGNELVWTTAHEVNTRSFIIERSSDGIEFDAIGTVAATGAGSVIGNIPGSGAGTVQTDNSGNSPYQFIDNAPATVNFYRLKMVDADGSFSYSVVKKCSNTAGVSISCYPNPVVDYVTIRIGQSSGAVYYSLVTLDGKIMQSGKTGVDGTTQTVRLSLSAAPKGIYLVRVQESAGLPGGTQTFKIVKQ